MRILIIFLCLISCSAFADYPISYVGRGSGFGPFDSGVVTTDFYDRDSGLLFTFFSPNNNEEDKATTKTRHASNVFIYNTQSKTGRNLFTDNKDMITGFAIETGTTKEGVSYYAIGTTIKNNDKQVKLHSSFLIETYNEKEKTYTVWTANKLQGEPTVLFQYAQPERWHLDAMNGVIRVLKPTNGTYSVKEFTW